MKKKACKQCKIKFEPSRPLQMVCSYKCGYDYVKESNIKKAKTEWKNEKKVIKEKLMTKKDYLNILQKVFNTFIRMRDKGKPCISCDKILTDKDTHASHMFSVGAYPNLRFNEFNVNSSCIECNLHKHGNVLEYGLRLPNRIGIDNYNLLLESRNKPLNLDITEVKELITIYKDKIKQLK